MTTGRIITADAGQVSARTFFDAITGRTDEQRTEERRRMDEQCIRAIERGDTYGWPPASVERCRKIMASRPQPYDELKNASGWL